VDRGRRWPFVGGIERAGTTSVALSGATCRVGSGDGIGARLRLAAGTAFLGWVARAGVDVRARRTGVRLRVVFAVVRMLLTGLLVVLRFAFALLAVAFAFAFVRLGAAVLAFFLLALPFTARFAAASATVPRAAAFAAFL